MVVVVNTDDIFSIGRESRCDQFGVGLNRYVPTKNIGELRWYARGRFSRDDAVLGTVTISQQAVAEKMVAKFGATRNEETPAVVGLELE